MVLDVGVEPGLGPASSRANGYLGDFEHFRGLLRSTRRVPHLEYRSSYCRMSPARSEPIELDKIAGALLTGAAASSRENFRAPPPRLARL